MVEPVNVLIPSIN